MRFPMRYALKAGHKTLSPPDPHALPVRPIRWVERNEISDGRGSMDSTQERHCLFRRGAFMAAHSLSIDPIFGMVLRSPQPKYPNGEHLSF